SCGHAHSSGSRCRYQRSAVGYEQTVPPHRHTSLRTPGQRGTSLRSVPGRLALLDYTADQEPAKAVPGRLAPLCETPWGNATDRAEPGQCRGMCKQLPGRGDRALVGSICFANMLNLRSERNEPVAIQPSLSLHEVQSAGELQKTTHFVGCLHESPHNPCIAAV